jgi:hypothetical protein
MPILTILIVLIVVGVLLWLINTYVPMQRSIKNILNAVVVIVVVIWLLKAFGVWGSIPEQGNNDMFNSVKNKKREESILF